MTETDAIHGGVLLPYQVRWIEDGAEVKVCEKSRRVGLSWCEAADAVLIASAEHGDDYWYVGYNQDMAEEFVRDAAWWSLHFGRAAGEVEEGLLEDERRDIRIFRIRFASGKRITALSSRPTNLRGKQGVICLDEAAFHDQLGQLIKAAIALLMWGGKVRILSTHNGDDNPFNELILDCRAGKRPYSVHRVEFQEAVNQGLYRRICRMLDREWSARAEAEWVAGMYHFYAEDAAEELDVIPSSGEGAFLPRAMIEAAMRPAEPVVVWAQEDGFTYQSEASRRAAAREFCAREIAPILAGQDKLHRYYYGSDFARSGDASDIWVNAVDGTLNRRTAIVVELRNIPFDQQRQILFYVIERVPRFVAGAHDARGNGQYLAEAAAQKFGATRIAEVMATTQWYREHTPRLRASFEDRTQTVPKDADTLTDLRMMVKVRGVPTIPDNVRVRGADGRYRHGDRAIALLMCQYAEAEMEPVPIEFASTGPRTSTSDAMAGFATTADGHLPDINDLYGFGL